MSLIKRAQNVLRQNDINDKFIKPSSTLYLHQWLWDSCFAAMGLSHFDIERAKQEIYSLLQNQWKDGMIPHINFNPAEKFYYPNKERWNIPEKKPTSGITQPPLIAIAAWKIYNQDNDKKF